MGASFDPYREWLGIHESRSAINYYRLFRLTDFESDATAIAAAADTTIARIREINTESATLGELQARLLAQLTAARQCLLNPASRARYDAKLRSRSADPGKAGTSNSAAPHTTPPDDEPMIEAALWQDSDAIEHRLHSAPEAGAWQGALGFGAAAVILVGIGLALWQMQTGERDAVAVARPAPLDPIAAEPTGARVSIGESSRNAATSGAAASTPTIDEPQGLRARHNQPLRASESQGASLGAASDSAAGGPAQSPAAAAIFRRAVNQARVALVDRDLERAREQLALAARDAATPEQRAQVDRLARLTSEVERFFGAVRAGLQKLEPTDEIRVDDWIAVVVERGPERLALFDEGSRRDYTLATLPARVALFAAKTGADEKSPEMKVATGAFQVVDPAGDRAAARRLWDEASAAGQEVGELMEFLDGSALAVSHDPVPDEQLVAAAQERVERDLAAAMEAAKSSAEKSELAIKLLSAAHDAASPVDQYALLTRSGRLATSADDARLALEVAEELAHWFDVDDLALKARTLSELDPQRGGATMAKYIARRALELAEEAKTHQRVELAKSLADTGLAAARKARDPQLLKKITQRRRELSAPMSAATRAAAGPSKKSRPASSDE